MVQPCGQKNIVEMCNCYYIIFWEIKSMYLNLALTLFLHKKITKFLTLYLFSFQATGQDR